MNTYYLAHHGISGMKWGVWNEETRRKRMGGNRRSASRAKRIEKQLSKASNEKYKDNAEKRIKKAAYLQELDSPGSTKLSTEYLNKKKWKNITAAVIAGREAVGGYLASGVALSTIPTSISLVGAQYTAAVLAGVVPMAAIMAGVGVGATKLTVDSIKRAKSLHNTISDRKDK